MSLPTRQRRILEQIEGGLRRSDPTLLSLFVIFTRLTRDELMPRVETVQPRPFADRVAWLSSRVRRLSRRPAARVRAMLLVPAALVAMACAVTLAAVSPGRGAPGARQHAAREQVVKTPGCGLILARVPAFGC